jgi:hypothetical protein
MSNQKPSRRDWENAERALVRLNPRLLSSGVYVNRIEGGSVALCALGAYTLSQNTRGRIGRIEPSDFGHSGDLHALAVPEYYDELRDRAAIQDELARRNEGFRYDRNSLASCKARYRHVLSWIRRQLRASEAADE